MSEEKKHQDDQLRELLNQASGPSGWDVPGDDVWLGVKEAIASKPKKRRWGLIVIPFLILVTGLIWWLNTPEVPGVSIESEANLNVESQTKPAPEKGAGPAAEISKMELISRSDKLPSTDISDIGQGPVNPGDRSISSNDQVPVERTYEHQGEQNAPQEPADLPVASQGISQGGVTRSHTGNSAASDIATSARNQVEVPELIQTSVLPVRRAVAEQPISFPTVEPILQKRTNDWMMDISFAPSLATRRITVAQDHSRLQKILLEQQENPRVKYGAGLSFSRNFTHRLALGIGAEYTNFHLESQYIRQIRYTRVNEQQNTDGNFENNYRVSFNTSYGKVQTDIVIERDRDAAISENTFIDLQFDMDQSLQFLQLPLFVRYKLNSGNNAIYLKGGVSANLLLDNRFDFRGVQILNGQVKRVRSFHSGKLEGANRLTFGYQFGFGIELPLSSRMGFIMEPTVSGNFNPIYRNDELNVYPIIFDAHVGIRYRL